MLKFFNVIIIITLLMCLQGFSIAANWEHLDKLQYIKTTCIYKMKQGKSYLQKE